MYSCRLQALVFCITHVLSMLPPDACASTLVLLPAEVLPLVRGELLVSRSSACLHNPPSNNSPFCALADEEVANIEALAQAAANRCVGDHDIVICVLNDAHARARRGQDTTAWARVDVGFHYALLIAVGGDVRSAFFLDPLPTPSSDLRDDAVLLARHMFGFDFVDVPDDRRPCQCEGIDCALFAVAIASRTILHLRTHGLPSVHDFDFGRSSINVDSVRDLRPFFYQASWAALTSIGFSFRAHGLFTPVGKVLVCHGMTH